MRGAGSDTDIIVCSPQTSQKDSAHLPAWAWELWMVVWC